MQHSLDKGELRGRLIVSVLSPILAITTIWWFVANPLELSVLSFASSCATWPVKKCWSLALIVVSWVTTSWIWIPTFCFLRKLTYQLPSALHASCQCISRLHSTLKGVPEVVASRAAAQAVCMCVFGRCTLHLHMAVMYSVCEAKSRNLKLPTTLFSCVQV